MAIYANNGTLVVDDSRNLYLDYVYGNLISPQFNQGPQGVNYGYASGGFYSVTYYNIIERYPFATSSTGSSDVGDLTILAGRRAGNSSDTYGYASGGLTPAGSTKTNVIERFPFAVATTNSADVGDLTVERERFRLGQTSSTYGYVSGGGLVPGTSNIIDRFPFASSPVNASDVGDLTIAVWQPGAQSSAEYGYSTGGTASPTGPWYNTIERWPFASSTTNASDVGDLTGTGVQGGSNSSKTYGYSIGIGPTFSNIIDRFPFASSPVNASDVGDLTAAVNGVASTSSAEYGYGAGGALAPSSTNVIERFPFAVATTNSADVGDLTVSRAAATGQQY